MPPCLGCHPRFAIISRTSSYTAHFQLALNLMTGMSVVAHTLINCCNTRSSWTCSLQHHFLLVHRCIEKFCLTDHVKHFVENLHASSDETLLSTKLHDSRAQHTHAAGDTLHAYGVLAIAEASVFDVIAFPSCILFATYMSWSHPSTISCTCS